MTLLFDPRLTGPATITLTDQSTGLLHTFAIAGDNGRAGETVYSIRALLGDASISDETWVQCRDLTATPAPTLNPRVDNAPAHEPPPPPPPGGWHMGEEEYIASVRAKTAPVLDINVDDVIAEAPTPIAPPEAPKAKRGK